MCCHRDTSCGICLYPLSTAGPFCSFYYSKDSLVRSLPWQLPYLERLLDLPLEHRRGTPWCPNMVPLGLNLCWYSEHQNSLLGSPINCFKSCLPGGARPVQGTQGQSLFLPFPSGFFWPPFLLLVYATPCYRMELLYVDYRTEPRVRFG